MLLIWCKCVTETPQTPVLAGGTPQEMWRGDPCWASSAGSCSSEWTAAENGSFLGRRFCSPCPCSQAGWVGAARFQPVLGIHKGWGTKPVLLLLLNPGKCLRVLLFLKHLLKAAAFFILLLPLKHRGRVCTSGVCYGVVPAFSCCH